MRFVSVIPACVTSVILGFSGALAQTPAPAPTHTGIAYAPAEPTGSQGHLLDLYIPKNTAGPVPVVIWTGGSAWLQDNGRDRADTLAAQLLPAGYAVAGVSIRSSRQAVFPAQVHDIKAAIRWLRANSAEYGLDPDRIGIVGDSSGGWTSAMAALTGDVPELEGSVGTTDVPSTVAAAVALYPPTDFSLMDAWALRPCRAGASLLQGGCHADAESPESRLLGCTVSECFDEVQKANPARYISTADPPLMILHGQSDPLVPHHQGEQLYQALNKACRDATFISVPMAGHGPPQGLITGETSRGATIRSTKAEGCAVENPRPFEPSWRTVVDFLGTHLK